MNYDFSKLSKSDINSKMNNILELIETADAQLRQRKAELWRIEKKRRPRLSKVRKIEENIEFFNSVVTHLRSLDLIYTDIHNELIKS